MPSTFIPSHGRPKRHVDVQFVSAEVPAHWFKTKVIVVDPAASTPSSQGSSVLPNTGGPLGPLVVIAFGLMLTGTAVLRLARRRVTPAPAVAG